MSHEHTDQPGVHMVCESCAPKPGKFAGQDPNSFLGKLVKLAFKGLNTRTQRESKEHMWVKAMSVDTGVLTGILLNYPVFEMEFTAGDEVSFKVEEIEDVTDDESVNDLAKAN